MQIFPELTQLVVDSRCTNAGVPDGLPGATWPFFLQVPLAHQLAGLLSNVQFCRSQCVTVLDRKKQ